MRPLELVGCPDPDCDAPAEIGEWVTITTRSAVCRVVYVRCARRHWFLMPKENVA